MRCLTIVDRYTAPVIADLSSWLADVAGKAGIAWERLFDAPEEKSLRALGLGIGVRRGGHAQDPDQ